MKTLFTIILAGMGSMLLFAALLPSFVVVVVPSALAQTNSANGTTTASEALGLNRTRITVPDEPLAVGHYRTVSENSMNNTIQISIVGNTTFTLPNSTETITTNDTGNVTITFTESGGILKGHVYLTGEDGSENATVAVTKFFSSENAPGRGIASFSTNSTGKLAPLDDVVAVTLDEEQSDGSVKVSFFEWQGGPLVDNNDPGTALGSTGNNLTITAPQINASTIGTDNAYLEACNSCNPTEADYENLTTFELLAIYPELSGDPMGNATNTSSAEGMDTPLGTGTNNTATVVPAPTGNTTTSNQTNLNNSTGNSTSLP